MIFPGHPLITTNPDICFGKPTVRGTRMRVCDILDMLGAGMTEAEIIEDFDFVSQEDIRASLRFASVVLERPMTSALAIAAE